MDHQNNFRIEFCINTLKFNIKQNDQTSLKYRYLKNKVLKCLSLKYLTCDIQESFKYS